VLQHLFLAYWNAVQAAAHGAWLEKNPAAKKNGGLCGAAVFESFGKLKFPWP
jgi:hypothetical protein